LEFGLFWEGRDGEEVIKGEEILEWKFGIGY
jgi:hypothetical protein